MYLVDTDWLIDAMTGVKAANAELSGLAGEGLAISIVTHGEIYEGVHGSPDSGMRLATLRGFISSYHVINFSEPVMESFA